MWVRGLKRNAEYFTEKAKYVAPHVGAWIETRETPRERQGYFWSHPMWVRGLKLCLMLSLPTDYRRTPCGCVD